MLFVICSRRVILPPCWGRGGFKMVGLLGADMWIRLIFQYSFVKGWLVDRIGKWFVKQEALRKDEKNNNWENYFFNKKHRLEYLIPSLPIDQIFTSFSFSSKQLPTYKVPTYSKLFVFPCRCLLFCLSFSRRLKIQLSLGKNHKHFSTSSPGYRAILGSRS